jgi:hypothetical protein
MPHIGGALGYNLLLHVTGGGWFRRL